MTLDDAYLITLTLAVIVGTFLWLRSQIPTSPRSRLVVDRDTPIFSGDLRAVRWKAEERSTS